jgi:hypothetical protein
LSLFGLWPGEGRHRFCEARGAGGHRGSRTGAGRSLDGVLQFPRSRCGRLRPASRPGRRR